MNRIPLADGVFLNTDGINKNILVVGSTGSGKTTSVSEPRITETFEESLVIPIVKRRLYDKYAPILKERGYKVVDLNLAHPEKSTHCFNPLEKVERDSEILELATEIAGTSESRAFNGESDPYWGEATVSTVAAEIGLALENAKSAGRKASFIDVLQIHDLTGMDFSGSHAVSFLDPYFARMEEENPSAGAPRLWKTMASNASKTASCIYSMVNNAFDKFQGEEMTDFFKNKEAFELGSLGLEKTALFITTSPAGKSSKKLSNLLYSCLFRALFAVAEGEGSVLPVPVHIIADDFACGSKIPGFASYVSVFREIGISCTLMLQSLSQLESTYGPYEAKVIEDNCDTRLFLGSNDLETVRDVSRRLDVPEAEVLALSPGSVVVSTRGRQSKVFRRCSMCIER